MNFLRKKDTGYIPELRVPRYQYDFATPHGTEELLEAIHQINQEQAQIVAVTFDNGTYTLFFRRFLYG